MPDTYAVFPTKNFSNGIFPPVFLSFCALNYIALNFSLDIKNAKIYYPVTLGSIFENILLN